MAHYFTNDEVKNTEILPVDFSILGRDFLLSSQAGIFSKDKLDTGTRILLETVLEEESPCKDLLDLGCGIGVIGVVMASFWKCPVTGIDINERACRLAETNYRKYRVHGKVLCQDGVTGEYDCILLNPPIRAGKSVYYRLFQESYDHLKENGCLYIVIRKNHGAPSAMKYLDSLGFQTERINRDKGFWVLKCTKVPPQSHATAVEDESK